MSWRNNVERQKEVSAEEYLPNHIIQLIPKWIVSTYTLSRHILAYIKLYAWVSKQ